MENHLSLSELNSKIKNVLKTSLDQTYWVVAEISNLNFNQSGHCYLELIEKDTNTDNIIARSKANIWAYALRMIKPYFETSTGQALANGLKVLVNAGVEFHEMYGLSLNIINIDPSYTIGDLERRKNEIIHKLTEDGVINMNKELEIPIVPQKIAIISSETAAGYEDLINQLETNIFGYKFYHKLFSAYMQGENAEESIINALEKIYYYEDLFDLVLIIRGGGSQSDLNCFNNYQLAYHITQFPLPVITGIGHERDETIVDMVANRKFKTPTAVAEFIIDTINNYESLLNESFYEIIEYAEDIVQTNKAIFDKLATNFINSTIGKTKEESSYLKIIENNILKTSQNYFNRQNYNLANYSNKLKGAIKYSFNRTRQSFTDSRNRLRHEADKYLSKNNFTLKLYESKVESQDPRSLLKKGYSITLSENKLVKNTKKLKKGQTLKTVLANGEIESTIKNF